MNLLSLLVEVGLEAPPRVRAPQPEEPRPCTCGSGHPWTTCPGLHDEHPAVKAGMRSWDWCG